MFCQTDSSLLSVQTPYNIQDTLFFWKKDGLLLSTTNNSLLVNTGGNYSVSTDTNGTCYYFEEFTISVIDTPIPSIVVNGDTLFLTSHYTDIQWWRSDPLLGWQAVGNNTASIVTNQGELYYVEVTDSFGCTGISNVVTVHTQASRIDNIKAFPNPASDIIHIEVPFDSFELSVVNMLGQTVFPLTRYTSNRQSLYTKYLENGIYILCLKKDDQLFMKKIMINHN